MVLFGAIREVIDHDDVPAAFRGTPLALVTAGLMSLAFMGFSRISRVTLWITPLLLVAALLMFAIAYARLVKTYPLKTDALVDTVDLLLPQTQCAQCGYPGCRPYAEAVVHQHASA